MKKIVITLILLIAGSTSLFAQRFERKGFSLGADRDTLLYIIASPFDNWWINLGGGIQTFIGNEVESDARWNKLNYNISAEIGKWIIPDLAVSLRLNFMNVDGQSRYPLQPFIDYTGVPTHDEDGISYYDYQPFYAHAFTLMGFVTFVWTNFFNGYEVGRRRRLHWYTPIGLGASMLFGTQENPNGSYELGSFRRNFELAYSFRVGAEYTFTEHLAANASLELFGSESTWDWSPYDNQRTIFDIIPSFNIGVKLNLFKSVTKYNPYTRTSSREKVNHEFLAYGSRNTMQVLNGTIERLNHELDSIADRVGYLEKADSARIDSLRNEIAKAIEDRDRLMGEGGNGDNDGNGGLGPDAAPGSGYPAPFPRNVIDELLNANEVLNLPAAIVYYQLDKWDLDYNATKRLEDFYKKARHLDDTVEFYIIGAADSVTGSIRHNQWLSEHRSKVAFDKLVELGMSANQLVPVSIGGIMHYDPKENNRMALVIQRTPITEEIVERWRRQSKERLKK